MRTVRTPTVLLVLALAGCGADGPTAPVPDMPTLDRAAAAHRAAPERPIKGKCEAETIEVEPIAPGVVRRVSVGTCQLSHLGRTQLLSVAITNLVTFEQTGEHTFTAANGDQLHATSAGAGTFAPPATLHFTGVTTITGGTGRFTNATGVMEVLGISDLAAGSTSLTYDGWIAY
jgi:predicted small lipoprotein YifL